MMNNAPAMVEHLPGSELSYIDQLDIVNHFGMVMIIL